MITEQASITRTRTDCLGLLFSAYRLQGVQKVAVLHRVQQIRDFAKTLSFKRYLSYCIIVPNWFLCYLNKKRILSLKFLFSFKLFIWSKGVQYARMKSLSPTKWLSAARENLPLFVVTAIAQKKFPNSDIPYRKISGF